MTALQGTQPKAEPGAGEQGAAAQVRRPDWPKSAVRVGFGIMWAIDAGLKWRASFRAGYLGMLRRILELQFIQ